MEDFQGNLYATRSFCFPEFCMFSQNFRTVKSKDSHNKIQKVLFALVLPSSYNCTCCLFVHKVVYSFSSAKDQSWWALYWIGFVLFVSNTFLQLLRCLFIDFLWSFQILSGSCIYYSSNVNFEALFKIPKLENQNQ